LQNAGDTVITDTTSMRIEFVDATPDIQPATIFGMDNRKIEIPANSSATTTQMTCKMSKDLEVFAVLGHMHKYGVHLDLSRGAAAGDEILYEEEWKFEQQPVTPKQLHVKKDDTLHLRCTHKNTTTTPVVYGESSDTEMCAFVMYYAPATALDGCINM
jgi:hypothetical protein